MSNCKYLGIIWLVAAIVAMIISNRGQKFYEKGYEAGKQAMWEEVERNNEKWWVSIINRRMENGKEN